MIFLARHDVKRNIRTTFLHDVCQIFHLLFKNIQRAGNPDVISSLRTVYAQSGTLSAGQKHCRHLPAPNRFCSRGKKFFPPLFNVFQRHSLDGPNISPLSAEIFGIFQHLFERPVYFLYSFQQTGSFRAVQLFIKSEKLLLPLFLQQSFCLFVSHKFIHSRRFSYYCSRLFW